MDSPPLLGQTPFREPAISDPTSLHAALRVGSTTASEELYHSIPGIISHHSKQAATWGYDPGDLCHDVFLSVSQAVRLGSVKQPEHLGTFIRSTAHHKAIASLRRTSVARRSPGQITSRTSPSLDESIETDERVCQILLLLPRLAPIDQAIIRRFYMEGIAWQNIAQEFQLTATQFRLRKHRALARIRELAAGPKH